MLLFLDQDLIGVGVSTEIVITMLDNDEVSITPQSITRIDYPTIGSGFNNIASVAGYLDSFVSLLFGREGANHPTIDWPYPATDFVRQSRTRLVDNMVNILFTIGYRVSRLWFGIKCFFRLILLGLSDGLLLLNSLFFIDLIFWFLRFGFGVFTRIRLRIRFNIFLLSRISTWPG